MLIISIIIVFGSGLELYILEQREVVGAALDRGHCPTLSHVKLSSSWKFYDLMEEAPTPCINWSH